MLNIKQQRDEELAAARKIADGAKAARRGLTEAEHTSFDAHIAKFDALTAQVKAAEGDELRLARMVSLDDNGTGEKSFLRFNAQQLGKQYAAQQTSSSSYRTKALGDSDLSIVTVPLAPSPVSMGRPAQGLLDVLSAAPTAREYSYLRQVTRTNNAAVVASGALKPTSIYQMLRIEGRLKVLAHLAEPVDKFWLADNASLGQFVGDELLYGLRVALENEVINGSGVGEHLLGFNATSGIQTQAYVTDPIRTARAALTKVETIYGDSTAYFVLHPNDWEIIETQTLEGGQNVFTDAGAAAPIDRVARRLWSQPVALSLAVTPGTGWLVNSDATTLMIDTSGIAVEWATTGDNFQRNLITGRCEGRFDLATAKPMGIVKLDLTA